jgi:mono/diheme cytochrome c family protein
MKRTSIAALLAMIAACGGGEPQAEMPAAEEAPAAEVVAAFDAQGTFGTVCATCHGATGLGDGPAGAALNPTPASFADASFWETRTDEDIFAVIKEGGPARGKSPLMVGWGAQYDDEQIQALVEYIKTFQGG